MAETQAAPTGPVQFMNAMVSLTYIERPTPLGQHFGEQLAKGRIIGHKCPDCGKVYTPPRGFCPLDVVETTSDHEVDVQDKGTLTAFTIVTPVQYYGQKEREAYVQASILLDGADTPIGQARIDLPHDKIRAGMRVKAVWKAEGDRPVEGDSGWGAGVGGAISGWEPIDEPDRDVSGLGGM